MSSETPSNWFVKIDGTEYGPFSDSELKKWARQGNIRPDAEVRKGNGPWVSPTKVKGLLTLQQPTIPAPSEPEQSLADIIASAKAKRSSPDRVNAPAFVKLGRRGNNQTLYLSIAGIAVLCLLGGGYWYWYTLPENRERRASQKIAEGFKELAAANAGRGWPVAPSKLPAPKLPKPPKLLESQYFDTIYENRSRTEAGAAFSIKVKIRNESKDEVLTNVTYFTRTVKVGRSVREYQTMNENEPIRGGINPGETLEHEYLVRTEDVNGSELLRYRLPEGTVLQVSTDGENWVEAKHSDKAPELQEDSKKRNDVFFNGF
jgi:hypothetical protein